MSAAELARTLHIPTNRITQILKGQRAITATLPCAWANGWVLGRIVAKSSKSYELRQAQQELGTN